jgi:hypothetical protein
VTWCRLQDFVYTYVSRSELAKEKNFKLALSKTTAHEDSGGEPVIFEKATKQAKWVQYSQNGKLAQNNWEEH